MLDRVHNPMNTAEAINDVKARTTKYIPLVASTNAIVAIIVMNETIDARRYRSMAPG
jgi:hypothetical protein